MQQELAANEDEQKHLLDVITASKTSTEQLAASSTALLAELQTVVGGKDEFGAKRIAITEKQAVAGERLDSLKKELTVAETRRNQAAMEMVRQNSDYDHALEQLATEYRITLDEARAAVICWMKAMRLYVGVNCVWSVKLNLRPGKSCGNRTI